MTTVTLDLGDEARDYVDLLREIIGHWPYGRTHFAGGSAHLTTIAEQIEAQIKPPRIPEPGLWGVVEAGAGRIPIRRWVHHEEDWWVADTGDRLRWEDLDEPIVPVREGLS